jgi:predicted esterase
MQAHPHAGQPVLRRGPPPRDARLVMILAHGRGSSGDDMLGLAHQLSAEDVSYLAPEAAGHTWYPHSFLAPIEKNEPYLSSALRRLGELVDELGVSPDRIVLLGFSQGACLSLEFAARHAQRYAGIVALSGGLIGPPGTPWDYAGSFGGTAVFLGCSDVDPHIPLERVHESAGVFRQMGATVDERIYPRMGHTVNGDEIGVVEAMLSRGAPGRVGP